MPGDSSACPPSPLARFFEHTSDLLAHLDADGCVLLVSASLARLLNREAGSVVGRPALRYVHPDDRASVLTRVRQLSTNGTISSLHLRLLRADGSPVPTRWTLSVACDGGVCAVGRPPGREPGEASSAGRNDDEAGLRLRTAMELHDGILQALTGANLKIAVARRLMGRDRSAAEEVLADLAEILSAEQREIRLYVDEVKGEAARATNGGVDLEERVASMLDRVNKVWGVRTSLEADFRGDLSPEMERRVVRIIQEATVNAARHGGAEAVDVRIDGGDDELGIHVVDDGHGFPFLGKYDTAELREKRLGPVSLKHRIAEVEGSIFLRSTPTGSTFAIRVPTRYEEDA